MGYKSLSPYCPNVTNLEKGDHLIEGYIVGVHICGWCICIDRNVISEIGGLNEDVEFWYSDNIYGEQIRRAGIKHALVCNSFVEHTCYGSNTLKSMPRAAQYDYTVKQLTSYNKALQGLYVEAKENNN
jgi:GT2 family glycosyltransferase